MAFDVRNSLTCLNSGLCLTCLNINELADFLRQYVTRALWDENRGSRCLNKCRKSFNFKFANSPNQDTNTPMPWQMYRQRIFLHIEYKIYSFENEKSKNNCTSAFAAEDLKSGRIKGCTIQRIHRIPRQGIWWSVLVGFGQIHAMLWPDPGRRGEPWEVLDGLDGCVG